MCCDSYLVQRFVHKHCTSHPCAVLAFKLSSHIYQWFKSYCSQQLCPKWLVQWPSEALSHWSWLIRYWLTSGLKRGSPSKEIDSRNMLQCSPTGAATKSMLRLPSQTDSWYHWSSPLPTRPISSYESSSNFQPCFSLSTNGLSFAIHTSSCCLCSLGMVRMGSQ